MQSLVNCHRNKTRMRRGLEVSSNLKLNIPFINDTNHAYARRLRFSISACMARNQMPVSALVLQVLLAIELTFSPYVLAQRPEQPREGHWWYPWAFIVTARTSVPNAQMEQMLRDLNPDNDVEVSNTSGGFRSFLVITKWKPDFDRAMRIARSCRNISSVRRVDPKGEQYDASQWPRHHSLRFT